MRTHLFVLLVETAATAYLLYYVLATGGGYLAEMSVAVMVVHVISSWIINFLRLRHRSAHKGPRVKGND